MITLPNGKTHADFVAECRKLLGVPFRHRGRNRFGLDCAGLIVLALEEMGVVSYDIRIYGREPHRDGLRQAVIKNMGEPVAVAPVIASSIRPGDVLLLKFESEPHHLAVATFAPYTSEDGSPILSMIHTFGDVGKVVEHRVDQDWLDKVLEVYRLPSGVIHLTDKKATE